MSFAEAVRNEPDLRAVDRAEDAGRGTVGHGRTGAAVTVRDDGHRTSGDHILIRRRQEGGRAISRETQLSEVKTLISGTRDDRRGGLADETDFATIKEDR